MNLFLTARLTELNFFLHDSQNWTFFYTTHRIDPFFFIRLKKLNPFFKNMTQRIEIFSICELFLLKFDKKNKELNILFKKWLKRFELSYRKMSQRMKLFFSKQNDSKIFLKNLTQIIEAFLMTERIELSWKTWLKELNHYLNMTHRIEPFFSTWLEELNLLVKYDSKNWNGISKFESKNWTRFFQIWLALRI